MNKNNLFKSLVSVFCAAILLGGCNQSVTTNGNHFSGENPAVNLAAQNPSQSNRHMIGERQYLLSLPGDYDKSKSYKLLLAFHGSGSNSTQMQSMAAFTSYSSDYIVAYPKSKVEEWNEGCNCNKPQRLGIDDLGFVDQVIDDISSRHWIDEDEIFAVGFSQGGLFAQNLLCNRSERFKAIASVASPMSLQLSQSCEIAEPTSYMMVHGTNDTVLPFHGYQHHNFPLISAPDAIALLAGLNKSLANPLVKKQVQMELTAHWNGKQKTHLYAAKRGRHTWSHEGFNTSQAILDFFASAHTPEVPEHSELLTIGQDRLHVRTMGQNDDKPTVVLISGPNKNFHSDTAWFALLQSQLAKHYKVIAVDRPGNAWSDFNEQTSYLEFTDQLHQVLRDKGEKEVILVAFASGNITATDYQQKYVEAPHGKLTGMVWVDPDIFLPHSIAMYQDYPVTWYREKLAQLMPYLASGAWTERTQTKITAEREEIAGMIPAELANEMDWHYFDLLSQQRLLVDRQQTRAIEIAHYYDDLEAMKNFQYIKQIPVSVIDSDFELGQIEAFPDAAETLTKWMEEGTQWSKQVTSESGGQYIPVTDAHHLVPLQYPQLIIDAVTHLIEN